MQRRLCTLHIKSLHQSLHFTRKISMGRSYSGRFLSFPAAESGVPSAPRWPSRQTETAPRCSREAFTYVGIYVGDDLLSLNFACRQDAVAGMAPVLRAWRSALRPQERQCGLDELRRGVEED